MALFLRCLFWSGTRTIMQPSTESLEPVQPKEAITCPQRLNPSRLLTLSK
jgi:hypothetical protein